MDSENAAGPVAIDALVEEIASRLDASVREDEGIYHLLVTISPSEDEEALEEVEEDDEDGAALAATVTLSASEDGETVFATRHLCTYDETIDLEELLRDVGGTIHVQLAIDEEGDLMLSAAAPASAPADWLADMIQELADFAPELADEEDDEDDEAPLAD